MKLADRFVDLATRPVPLRTLVMRRLLQHFPIGSWERRIRSGAVRRPQYAWCLHYTAVLAKCLGYRAFTVVELGVAGGNGLLCLCDHALQVRKELGIDRAMLEQRLAGRAELVFGNVSETVPRWQPPEDAPLGCVLFDLDLYTSTRDALPLLTKVNVLPRIWCYFDDISGYPHMALTDFIGEGAAVREFNDRPDRAELGDNVAPARIFADQVPEMWHRKMYIYHRLSHPQYEICLSKEKHRLPLAV